MSLLVTGSIGIDDVTTPHGTVEGVLGGSAVYFSFAATNFVPVRLVGVVGDDFPADFRGLLESRDIDLAGLEVREGSNTFRWTGEYAGSMNEAETKDVSLNVLAEDAPAVPASFADSECVFLANTHPTLQRTLLSQVRSPRLVVCDTMNLWIETERESLIETLSKVTGVILNDDESRMLTGEVNMIEAGEAIIKMGPKFVIIKKGEHGALLVTPEGPVAMPAFPSKLVRDPTGAGDSFAGGVMGYLSASETWDRDTLRSAMVRGTVTASFTIEDFSIGRISKITREDIDARIAEYVSMLRVS